MRCSVEGCNRKSDGEPEGSKEYNLCPEHYKAWGYFFKGYRIALGKDDRRLRRGLWNKAMRAFLSWCEIEISACTEIAEAIIQTEMTEYSTKNTE